MSVVYVDESGYFGFGREGDNYFTVAALVSTQSRPIAKAMERAKKTKLPSKYRHLSEVKFSDTRFPRYKRRVFEELAKQDISIYSLVCNTAHIPHRLRGKEGVLYCHIIGALLTKCPLGESQTIHIYLDRRSLKGLTREEFDTVLYARLALEVAPHARIAIRHVDSTTSRGIQAVDHVCGAIHQKYQSHDTTWYEFIKGKIVVEELLFDK